ncbi:DUF2809 domain-containing protein [Agrobacterium rosae]|uniref:DUF2809 domain-containing protein n=1 Tax=Agrobacterium rosae TaxID=1972867 RepID=A0AAE5RWI2_9HYPH|nr:DUF2809 domain-containing protein [Agrobacterium rosae]KAA3510152.1 DUF2809 domain-containing protein [Agrobacterium rosae]KAA3514904.1 DUF2809 domain-containing protein [Agrobacterium rosae]MCM2433358.1 DUF2809 domain-containing protein [Agrobacterium rosae]MDX8332008.1 DUF2809 domain-containing protein [Agrobacterium rosae]MQB50774.1 DUF2809 domain-containing protein [Agrobacterium rosae]
MIDHPHSDYFRRLGLAASALAVVVAGLALRRYGYAVGLPFLIVKYGGSILWGSMVYLVVVSVAPFRNMRLLIGVACATAVIVELIRLVHFPVLDEFRATTAGALLLGRVFSPWNISCYLAGIALAALIVAIVVRRPERSS